MTPKKPLLFWCPIDQRPVVPDANTCPACGRELAGDQDHIILMTLDEVKLSQEFCLNNPEAVAEIILSDTVDRDIKSDLLNICMDNMDYGGGFLLEAMPLWTRMVEKFILPRFDELPFALQVEIRWHFKRKYHFSPEQGEPPKGHKITFDLSQLPDPDQEDPREFEFLLTYHNYQNR